MNKQITIGETIQEMMEREIAEGTFVPRGKIFDAIKTTEAFLQTYTKKG